MSSCLEAFELTNVPAAFGSAVHDTSKQEIEHSSAHGTSIHWNDSLDIITYRSGSHAEVDLLQIC